jgi:type IVB pilus formation R64 PilN family outer membrane protein
VNIQTNNPKLGASRAARATTRTLLIPLLLALAACGSLNRINATMDGTDDAYATRSAQAASMRDKRNDPVQISDRPWVSLKPIQKPIASATPPALDCPIAIARQGKVSIYEIAQIITEECGVPVRLTPDAVRALSGQYTLPSAGRSNGSIPIARTSDAGLPPLPPIPAAYSNMGTQSQGGPDAYLAGISWSGKPLSGLLDTITSRMGLSWRYRNNAIQIFYVDTRNFMIYAIPSKTTMEYVVQSGTQLAGNGGSSSGSGVSNTGGGSTSGSSVSGGSNQTTKVGIEASLTDDIRTTLEAMITPGIGRVSLGANSVTVTDTPQSLERIAEYIQVQNRNITRQALFNVTVASVTATDSDGLGWDLGLVFKTLSGNYGINLANAFSAGANAATASVGVLDTASGSAAKFSGTRAILSALAQQGRVSVLTQPSVVTLNLQPVPVQIAKQTSYLASVATTNTAQVGSTATLTPGTVTTGFSMDLLPYIMDGDEMLLQFTMNLSPDPRLRTATSGDNQIEVPEVDSRIFSQRVRMHSGQTLILSGFEQRVDNGTKSGVGNPSNWIFGGGGTSEGRREVIVILITPVILDDQQPQMPQGSV